MTEREMMIDEAVRQRLRYEDQDFMLRVDWHLSESFDVPQASLDKFHFCLGLVRAEFRRIEAEQAHA